MHTSTSGASIASWELRRCWSGIRLDSAKGNIKGYQYSWYSRWDALDVCKGGLTKIPKTLTMDVYCF